MKTATELEAGIWRLRESGLTYSAIAERAHTTKGVVASILRRFRLGHIATPVHQGCRWVIGEPPKPGWAWCGAPVVKAHEWCPDHLAKVYRRLPATALGA
jgi:hypothetical protein